MSDERIALLKRMAVFGAASDDTLAFILERAGERHVPAGETFFRRGDEADAFFVLERGRVQVLREHEGRDFVLNELGPGDCFGEMALIECCTRSASVRALTRATAFEISFERS